MPISCVRWLTRQQKSKTRKDPEKQHREPPGRNRTLDPLRHRRDVRHRLIRVEVQYLLANYPRHCRRL
jgi:hypothetical protein